MLRCPSSRLLCALPSATRLGTSLVPVVSRLELMLWAVEMPIQPTRASSRHTAPKALSSFQRRRKFRYNAIQTTPSFSRLYTRRRWFVPGQGPEQAGRHSQNRQTGERVNTASRGRRYRLAYHSGVVYQAPKGTQDILPDDASYWAFVEREMRRQARLANYGEIRTPTFEDTGVFTRAVGEGTDIVEKEMYTFLDKGGDSMTLRPEATAGIVRAYLQRGMASRPQPVKLFTLLNAFRYDKPQKGRFREFHQIDFEAIGEADPLVDAELVGLQWRLYADLGLRNLSLQVNSIGDQQCRPAYVAKLKDYFLQHVDRLCEECRRRLDTNPLRLLDEKRPECQAVLEGAPRSAENLCEPCRIHFEAWLGYLDAAGIPYAINARLVRGLDYYTRSVWEVWPPVVGAQSTIGGGGRYDGLAEQLGGRPTPGVGFATGIERIILELKDQHVSVPPAPTPNVF